MILVRLFEYFNLAQLLTRLLDKTLHIITSKRDSFLIVLMLFDVIRRIVNDRIVFILELFIVVKLRVLILIRLLVVVVVLLLVLLLVVIVVVLLVLVVLVILILVLIILLLAVLILLLVVVLLILIVVLLVLLVVSLVISVVTFWLLLLFVHLCLNLRLRFDLLFSIVIPKSLLMLQKTFLRWLDYRLRN